MKNTVEGFKNEIDLKIFENRLVEINPTCFLVWKVGVNLALPQAPFFSRNRIIEKSKS